MQRTLLLLLVGLAMLPIVYLGWWFAVATDRIGTPFGELPFSQTAWKPMKNSRNRHGRARMARDLIDRYLRSGMKDTETISLLGDQDKTWDDTESASPKQHAVYEYDMGLAPLDLAGQHYLLRLYFDKLGHYERAEIMRD